LRCYVDGGPRAGEYEIGGEFYGEESARVIIGGIIPMVDRTRRIRASIDPRRE
jgi:hypothetical protein